jgi:hypothetical protein
MIESQYVFNHQPLKIRHSCLRIVNGIINANFFYHVSPKLNECFLKSGVAQNHPKSIAISIQYQQFGMIN